MKYSHEISHFYLGNIHKQVDTMILTENGTSYEITRNHKLCSYQHIVMVEVIDVNGESFLKIIVLTKSCLLR